MRRLLGLVLTASLAMAGCSSLSLGTAGTAKLALESSDGASVLRPEFTTAVFRSDDFNSVHLYLTDIPALATDRPPPNPTGNLLHVHMFLYPKAGKTPIDFTASNCTITHVVLAEGSIGVYRGGGFLLPSGRPSRRFAGRLADATLRPAAATPTFRDLLGWSEVTGKLNARRDDERAGYLADTLNAVTRHPDLVAIELEVEDDDASPEDQDTDDEKTEAEDAEGMAPGG